MSLFNKPKEGGDGDFWPKQNGTYVGICTGFEEGPEVSARTKDQPDATITLVRWTFKLFDMVGNPVTYVPEAGENAGQTIEVETDGLSTPTITRRSKSGGWFMALLDRDIDFDEADEEELMAECIGKKAMVVFGPNDSGKTVLTQVNPAPVGL